MTLTHHVTPGPPGHHVSPPRAPRVPPSPPLDRDTSHHNSVVYRGDNSNTQSTNTVLL